MKSLRRGSRDPEVTFLQRLLNLYFQQQRGVPGIVEDGIFGSVTEGCVRRYQTENRGQRGLTAVDGVASAEVWRSLGPLTEIDHNLPQVGQSTPDDCWAVSAGLATRRMRSALPPNAQAAIGEGLEPSLDNLARFATALGMRLLPFVPPTVDQIIGHLRQGPIMYGGIWPDGGKHMVVISGYYASTNPRSRMVKVNDPDPVGRGSIVLTEYPALIVEGGPMEPYCVIVR